MPFNRSDYLQKHLQEDCNAESIPVERVDHWRSWKNTCVKTPALGDYQTVAFIRFQTNAISDNYAAVLEKTQRAF